MFLSSSPTLFNYVNCIWYLLLSNKITTFVKSPFKI